MTLSALIRKRDIGKPATAIPAISATQPMEGAGTVARIATVAVANPTEAKTATPAKVGAGDTASIPRPADKRVGQMVAKLEGDPGLKYAMQAHDQIDPDAVILTLAIRGKGACELRIPRNRYDPFLLLDLIEQHSTTVH